MARFYSMEADSADMVPLQPAAEPNDGQTAAASASSTSYVYVPQASTGGQGYQSFPANPAALELTLEDLQMQDERTASTYYRFGPVETNNWQPSQFSNGRADDWSNNIDFAHCLLNEGDTLVFVDIPKYHKDLHLLINCDGVAPASQVFRVHSQKLKALTESKFPGMLDNEIYQARVRRQRKPEAHLLDGIKYLLDLTPAAEGDELASQMMELSLTPGIINWWNANLLHKIPSAVTRGHDDICSCKLGTPLADHHHEFQQQEAPTSLTGEGANDFGRDPTVTMPPEPEDVAAAKAQAKKELVKTPREFAIPDYCRFRHVNGIIRLLFLIEGNTVHMNSAARVWTMVGISKVFDCPSVVRDEVSRWLMVNSRFIEVLPDETIRIGYALKLPQVTQVAFRILVNELALEQAGSENSDLVRRRNVTIFGRQRGDTGDEARNAIQHAARALNDRLSGELAKLRKTDVFNQFFIPDWQRLCWIRQLLQRENNGSFDGAIAHIQRLMDALSYQVSGKVDEVLRGKPGSHAYRQMDKDRATYVAPLDWKRLWDIVPRLTENQKLLLPFFYEGLSESISGGWYHHQSSLHPAQDRKTFEQISLEAQEALQRLIVNVPARGNKAEWQFLLAPGGWLTDGVRRVRSPLVDLPNLDKLVKHKLWPIIRTWVRDRNDISQLDLTRHLLLTLEQDEMKFLPLWAGGNDDGTGGVFENFLPDANLGPNGPGPAYHTGETILHAPSDTSDSFMDAIGDMRITGSTTAASVDVHDSISTVYRPDRVIAADSSIASESFKDCTSDYDQARYKVPAAHQGIGQALDLAMDSSTDDDVSFEDDASDASDATETAHQSGEENEADTEMEDTEAWESNSTATSDAESFIML